MIKKQKIILLFIFLLLVGGIISLFIYNHVRIPTYEVKLGEYITICNVKGETKSTQTGIIYLPPSLLDKTLGIWNIEITDIVEEGTRLKQGDYIAQLDPSSIQNKLNDNQKNIDELQATLDKNKIDNEVTLQNLQKEIDLMDYDLASAKLDIDQSIYESAAYQRKMKLVYNNLLRSYHIRQRNYLLKKIFLDAKYKERKAKLEDAIMLQSKLNKALVDTRIVSPSAGLIMFLKDAWGNKIQKGSQVGAWNNQIATLPDISNLISEIYVNEVYIAKLKLGDSVTVTINALKDRKINGVITKIANVGQDKKGYNAKVFRVEIAIKQQGEDIKPYMNTNNALILAKKEGVITIPLNALQVDDEGSYVYLKTLTGFKKHAVTVKESNQNESWVTQGLKEGDLVKIFNE